MNAITPPLMRGQRGTFEGRWRWWYAAIADLRIQHPGIKNEDVAAKLQKHPNTISAITNTDMYRDYEAQRLQAYRDRADADLRTRLTRVASKTLEAIEDHLDKKKDQVPLDIARELAVDALDRLGFAPKVGPAVVVNNNPQTVNLPVAITANHLEEAREALRAVERRRLSEGAVLLEAGTGVEVELDLNSAGLEALEGGQDRGPSSADS